MDEKIKKKGLLVFPPTKTQYGEDIVRRQSEVSVDF